MKRNTFIHLIIIVLFSVFFSSCEDKKTTETQSPANQTSTTNTDTTKQVEENVETLQTKNEKNSQKTKTDFEGLKKEIKEPHAHYILYILMSIVIGFISSIIAIIAILKISKLNDRLKRHKQDIERLLGDILSLKQQKRVETSTPNSNLYFEFSYLKRKVTNLENTIKNVDTANQEDDKGFNVPTEVPKEISQTGYFGTAVSGEGGKGYFRRLLDSNDEARFLVIVEGTQANYEPIVPLDAIKSSDAMDLAIEFEGVSKNEANSMSLKNKGLARKTEDKWVVIKKAVVKLSKI